VELVSRGRFFMASLSQLLLDADAVGEAEVLEGLEGVAEVLDDDAGGEAEADVPKVSSRIWP
jgi:hypothetical protein